MKTQYLIFVLCFCFNHVRAQHGSDIVIGKIDSINSNILNEKREIWIHVPDGYSKSVLKKKKYPVLYLLDAHAHFHATVGIVKQLSTGGENAIFPKMIVVGILNTNRMRDLTPTKAKPKPPYLNNYMAKNSGGGDKFISFVQEELIPYVDSNYTTESYRTLIGHSIGGLTVMNTLIYKTQLFNSYVAIDPSMWWDDKKLLKDIKDIKLDKRYSNKSLFLGIANTMNKDMDTIRVKKDTSYKTRQIRSLLELTSFLNKDTLNNLSFKAKYYKEESHRSIPLIAEYDALRYIFDFYQIKIEKQDIMNPEKDVLGQLRNYYKRLSKEFGRKIKPELNYIESLGYQLMGVNQFKRAEQFFKLNVMNYPENYNVYNSLGDLYVALGDKEKATEYFSKSNSLNKNSYSTDQLNIIKTQ